MDDRARMHLLTSNYLKRKIKGYLVALRYPNVRVNVHYKVDCLQYICKLGYNDPKTKRYLGQIFYLPIQDAHTEAFKTEKFDEVNLGPWLDELLVTMCNRAVREFSGAKREEGENHVNVDAEIQ